MNPSERKLERLSSLSHAETHRCGNIEKFSLTDELVDIKKFLPPIISSFTTIEGLDLLVRKISIDNMTTHIQSLEKLPTRHYKKSAQQATNEVENIIKPIIENNSKFEIERFTHKDHEQESLIVRYATTSQESTILSAHLDSISRDVAAPGADDDATGVSALIEIIRLINDEGLSFSRNVEFHFYAAEEIGLAGSREIASSYFKDNRAVSSLLQIDMAAYSDEDTIYLVKDYTSKTKTRALIHTGQKYLDVNIRSAKLKFGGTSDHKSWHVKGYPTIFPFENPNKKKSTHA